MIQDGIFACAQKLQEGQLNLSHRTKQVAQKKQSR